MIDKVKARFGDKISDELASLLPGGWTILVDQLDMMKHGDANDKALYATFSSDEFLSYLRLLIQKAKMRDALESKARSVVNSLMEMPYYRMQRDLSRAGDDSELDPSYNVANKDPIRKGDVILPEAPTIDVHTGDHNILYRLLDPYRHCGDSNNNERIGQFVATQMRPGDTLYNIHQRGGWNQSFWVLLNPDEHRRLLGDIVRTHLNEGDEEMEQARKRAKLRRLAHIVGLAEVLFPIISFGRPKLKMLLYNLEQSGATQEHIDIVADVFNYCGNMRGVLDYIQEYVSEEDYTEMDTGEFKDQLERALKMLERGRVSSLLGESNADVVGRMMAPVVNYDRREWAWFKRFLKEEVDDDLLRVLEDIWITCNHEAGIVNYVSRYVSWHVISQLATTAFQEAFHDALVKTEGRILRHKLGESSARSVVDEMAQFHHRQHPRDDYGPRFQRLYYNRPGRPDSTELETPVEVIVIPFDATTDEVISAIEPFRHAIDYSSAHYQDTFEMVMRLTNDQFKTGDRIVDLDMHGVRTTTANPDKIDHIFLLVGKDEEEALKRFKIELQRIKISRRLESP